MLANRTFLLIITLFFIQSSYIFANLTTLQHWDPSPIYAANNFMMPSNSHIANLRKARRKEIKPSHSRCFGISFTGFTQGACRARDYLNCEDFGTTCGEAATGKELGDFRGTAYAFGVFLGNSPNGKSIWANGIDNGTISNITPDSINATELPSCLKDILKQLSGNFDLDTGVSTASGSSLTSPCAAMMIGPIPDETDIILLDGSNPLPDGPSIFNAEYLKNDTTCFGSFSLPLEYRKYGMRLEAHADISENISITFQTGFSHIKHKSTVKNTAFPFTANNLTNGQINSKDCDEIYKNLSFQGQNGVRQCYSTDLEDTDASCLGDNPASNCCLASDYETIDPEQVKPPGPGNPQAIFDDFFTRRLNDIFGSECGINQSFKNFEDYSIEDVRIFLTIKETHGLDRYFQKEDEDQDWPTMLFTAYGWAGGSFPVAKETDYTNLFSLHFGNNGHVSVGGGIGMAYDFAETIEVAAEIGCTYFISREEVRPFPNHKLQRLIYPFYARAIAEPGVNWHFKALLNAYQFIPHVNFWATYEFIEHTKDNYRFCFNNTVKKTNPNTNATIEEQIFYPEVLTCTSDWRSQLLNLGFVFDLQPGMQASLVWQQSIGPRNAYYPVSVIGSLSFTF